MTDGKKGRVEIKVGNLSFAAEGDQDWLAEQLTRIMSAAEPIISKSEVGDRRADASGAKSPGLDKSAGATATSLATYLKNAGGESKQVQRFLATAGWLFRRGAENLTTAAVSAALAEHHQKRLGNPADCLNQNVSKGYCEKRKDGFFITPEGWSAIGDEK